MSKQNADSKNASGFGTKVGAFEGSTSKHVHKVTPAKAAAEGNAAHGKHKRGKQG
jgi:hypothetical protein